MRYDTKRFSLLSKNILHMDGHWTHTWNFPNQEHSCLTTGVLKIVQRCLICTISAPKRVHNLIGSRRSNYYVPSQCLVIDSCYLPRSQHGYSKALIMVDAATGYVIVYPSTNLLATTVRKHLLTYLSSHLLPEEI